MNPARQSHEYLWGEGENRCKINAPRLREKEGVYVSAEIIFRDTRAFVLVDSVDALRSVPTGIGHAFVYVYLAVGARRASSTATLVPVDQILARAAVLAGRRSALVQLVLAQQPRVAGMAGARERVLAVDALAVLARVRQAVVDVVLAVEAREAGRALALVTGDRVVAYAAVPARAAHAVVDVRLAPRPREPCRARAFVPVDHVRAHAAVLARVRVAFVHVDFALRAREP